MNRASNPEAELPDRDAPPPTKREVAEVFTEWCERVEGISDADLCAAMGMSAPMLHAIRVDGWRPEPCERDRLTKFRDFVPSRELLARAKVK